MNITINNNQQFGGKVIVVDKISAAQNYLFNRHRANLEKMMADKPYDLFVKQSKSRKTITLSTDKHFRTGYFVRKNNQDFERVAQYEIERKDKLLKKEEEERIKTAQVFLEAKLNQNYFYNVFNIGF